jgi:hypothetical protein
LARDGARPLRGRDSSVFACEWRTTRIIEGGGTLRDSHMAQLPKRKKSAATERKGVNYIRSVVEESGSIFQEITRDNDYGNDAFIELVIDQM